MTPSREFVNALAWAIVAIMFAIIGTCLIGIVVMIKELI
jgi:hypothetical protein